MNVLFVIDPLASLNLQTETSLLLMDECRRRGHGTWITTVDGLSLREGGAAVRAQRIHVRLDHAATWELGTASHGAFTPFDLVVMRTDPPVDAEYIFATYVLERAAETVPVINDPVSLRTVNEKLLPLWVPRFSPPTLVSNDAAELAAFAAAHHRIVLKPLDDCSGRGIPLLAAASPAAAIPAYLRRHGGRHVLAQRFLPGVAAGDKRIFVLAGDPIGAVNRIPSGPEQLANIHQGARVEATTITPREHEIVAALRPILLKHRLWMAGIDVIDGWLTEVNVTSPSAVRQINAVSGTQLHVPIVDCFERLATLRGCDQRGQSSAAG